MKTLVFSLLYTAYVLAIFRWGKMFDREMEKAYRGNHNKFRWLARSLHSCKFNADILTSIRLLGAITLLIIPIAIGSLPADLQVKAGVPLAGTDFLDGLMAKYYGESAFGTFVDPVADKLLFVALSVHFVDFSLIGVALIITYLLFLATLIGVYYCKFRLRMPKEVLQRIYKANMDGKLKNNFQLLALVNLYCGDLFPAAAWFVSETSLVLLLAAIPLELRSQSLKLEKILEYLNERNREQEDKPQLRAVVNQ